MKTTLSLVACLGLVAACGSSDDEALTENSGLYTISTWTLDEGCDGGETSVAADHEPLLNVGNQAILGRDTVLAVVCQDDDSCSDRMRSDYQGPIDATFRFVSGSDDEGFTGFIVTAGSGFDSECEGSWTDVTMVHDGTSLTITSETTASVPIEPNSDGFCTTTAAEEAARGLPCAEREVLTATRR